MDLNNIYEGTIYVPTHDIFSLLLLPQDLVKLVLSKISEPSSFFNVLQTNKLVNSLCPIKEKMGEFTKRVETISPKIRKIYHKLPNKNEHGQELVYLLKDHSNSILIEEVNYYNGKLHGQWVQYHQENGKIKTLYNFVMDKQVGEAKIWNLIGQLTHKSTVDLREDWRYNIFPSIYIQSEQENNELHGLSKVYHILASGVHVLRQVILYRKGLRHGAFKKWDPFDRLAYMGYYDNELYHGIHKSFEYLENSNVLENTYLYENGKVQWHNMKTITLDQVPKIIN